MSNIPPIFELVEDDGSCKTYVYQIHMEDSTDLIQYELLVYTDGLYSLRKNLYRVDEYKTGRIEDFKFEY
jgi:hypothetical protein